MAVKALANGEGADSGQTVLYLSGEPTAARCALSRVRVGSNNGHLSIVSLLHEQQGGRAGTLRDGEDGRRALPRVPQARDRLTPAARSGLGWATCGDGGPSQPAAERLPQHPFLAFPSSRAMLTVTGAAVVDAFGLEEGNVVVRFEAARDNRMSCGRWCLPADQPAAKSIRSNGQSGP